MNDQSNKSPQILNSSSNFLGFCFLVLTSLKFFKLSYTTVIDEITGACFVVFMFSCLFAFLSMRSETKKAVLYEALAEYTFLSGLALIFIMTILFMFSVIH
jgi:hypothetical protein